MTFDEACNTVCRDIPEGWEITIHLENAGGFVYLEDPLGDNVRLPIRDDGTIESDLTVALAHAITHDKDSEYFDEY